MLRVEYMRALKSGGDDMIDSDDGNKQSRLFEFSIAYRDLTATLRMLCYQRLSLLPN